MANEQLPSIIQQYKGYFWSSTDIEKDVPGIITRYSNNRIELELIGSLNPDNNRFAEFTGDKGAKRKICVIHGLDSDAKKISLYAIRNGASQNWSCPFPMVKYRVIYMVYGKHIDDFEKLYNIEAEVRFPELRWWCPPDIIKQSFHYDKNKIDKISIEADVSLVDYPIYEEELSNEMTIKLNRDCGYDGGDFNKGPLLSQDTTFYITKHSGLSIPKTIKTIFRFEKFLTFATQKECHFSEIRLLDEETIQITKDGKKHYLPIYLYVERFIEEQRKTANFLFYYAEISDSFHKIINNWLVDDDDLPLIIEHLVDGVAAPRSFNSTDFMTIIQGVDGFWQRFREDSYRSANNVKKSTKIGLDKELESLINEFETELEFDGSDIDIVSINDTRDFYSHLLKKGKKKNVLQGGELYKTTKELRKLLVCCVMKETGFDSATINKVIKDRLI